VERGAGRARCQAAHHGHHRRRRDHRRALDRHAPRRDRGPAAGFAARTFAISGVSGGALGGAVFAAALRPDRPADADRAACQAFYGRPDPGHACFAGIGLRALSPDFLGPVMAAYLFGDTFGAPLGQLVPNRSLVLETAWEEACTLAGCPAMGLPLHAMRDEVAGRPAPWRPFLLLNGTHAETGKRIVTSQLRITARHFHDAFDFVEMTGRDLRLSTAVLNAARFPYVTPAGRLSRADGRRRATWSMAATSRTTAARPG
jgi:hypothetical protein